MRPGSKKEACVPQPNSPRKGSCISFQAKSTSWGVYAPPLVIAVILGTIAIMLKVYLLNRHQLSRYFLYPEFVMLALVSIYTTIIGTLVIPI